MTTDAPTTLAAPATHAARLQLVATGPDLHAWVARLRNDGLPAAVRLGVGRVDIAARRLAQLRGPETVYVDRGARFFPLLDKSAPAIGLDDSLRAERDGAGVLLAILDTGTDFTHPDFLHPDGSTRFVAYWDQTADDGAGVVCTGLMIATGECPNNAEQPIGGFAPRGHGTHVAGIAAGNDATFRGVAPGALLIGVRLDFDEAGIIDALAWVRAQADAWGLPVVANLSLGSNDGPHDGGAPAEVAIDAFSDAGRIAVLAAGNEASNGSRGPIHARGPITNTEYRARFRVDNRPIGTAEVAHAEIWADDGAELEIKIAAEQSRNDEPLGPILDETAWFPVDGGVLPVTTTLRDADGAIATLEAAAQQSATNARGARIRFANDTGRLDDVSFQIAWRGRRGTADLWVTDRNARFAGNAGAAVLTYNDGTTTSTLLVAGDNTHNLTQPGTAREGITVTGFVSRNSWTGLNGELFESRVALGTLLAAASRGPTRDDRLKPDLAAPGQWVASSIPDDETLPTFGDSFRLDELHGVISGTSMAAPHVAGVAALLLQGNAALTPAAVRIALRDHTVQDTDTGTTPTPAWGWGKLSLTGLAVDPVWTNLQANTDTTPPAIVDVDVARRDGRHELTWRTDELTQGAVEADDGAMRTRMRHGLEHMLQAPPDATRVRVIATDLAGNETTGRWLELGGGGGCRAAANAPLADAWIWLLPWGLVAWRRRGNGRQGGHQRHAN